MRDGIDARLIPARDAGALSRALVEVLSDPALRERFTISARQRVWERFGLHRMISEYEATLSKL